MPEHNNAAQLLQTSAFGPARLLLMMRSNYPAQVGHSTAPRAPIPIPAKPIDPGIREGSSQGSKAGSCARIHAVKTRPLNLADQLEDATSAGPVRRALP